MWVLNSPQIIQPPFSHLPLKYRPSVVSQQPTKTTITLCSSTATTTTANTTNRNPLIQTLCKKGDLKQALQLLSLEPNPTQQTCELLILTCSRKKSFSDAYNVHRNLVDNGFDHDPFLGTKLIDIYSELECIEYARQVFDKMTRRTIYVWNAILRALTLAGYGVEALGLYREMNRIGTPCDRFTHTMLLRLVWCPSRIQCWWRKGRRFMGGFCDMGKKPMCIL